MRLLAILSLIMLVGCGVDGKPIRPSLGATIGVNSSGNVSVGGTARVKAGPVSIGIGL